MLENLKLVVFDYPKYLPKTETNQKILSDLLMTKQESYQLSDERFVATGSLDFVGTHLIIYDAADIFNPKILLSVRNIFEKRVKYHNLRMPSDEYSSCLPKEASSLFQQFKSSQSNFVESGGLYVQTNSTFKKTGFPLVEVGMMMIVNHLIKCNQFQFLAATNSIVKAARWVSPMGYYDKLLHFNHPYVDQPHELFLFKDFNFSWLSEMHEKYFPLWTQRIDIRPSGKHLENYTYSDEELRDITLKQLQRPRAV